MPPSVHRPSSGAEPLDCFALLGLPRRFELDLAELERRYLDHSRAVHPDRLVQAPAAERARAVGAAMDLNRAYRVLKRGSARAEHMLALMGVAIGDNEAVAPALLHEVLELREELDEARNRGDRAALAALEARMRAREQAELDRAAAALAAVAREASCAQPERARSEGRELALANDRAERGRKPGSVQLGSALLEAKAACLALRYIHRYLEAIEAATDEDGG